MATPNWTYEEGWAYVLVEHSPRPLTVIMEDPIIHDDQHPFCSDSSCPCHRDLLLWQEIIGTPVRDGLMTPAEGKRLFAGQQLTDATSSAPRFYMLPCEEGDPDCYDVYDRTRSNADGQPYVVDSHLHEDEALTAHCAGRGQVITARPGDFS